MNGRITISACFWCQALEAGCRRSPLEFLPAARWTISQLTLCAGAAYIVVKRLKNEVETLGSMCFYVSSVTNAIRGKELLDKNEFARISAVWLMKI